MLRYVEALVLIVDTYINLEPDLVFVQDCNRMLHCILIIIVLFDVNIKLFFLSVAC